VQPHLPFENFQAALLPAYELRHQEGNGCPEKLSEGKCLLLKRSFFGRQAAVQKD